MQVSITQFLSSQEVVHYYTTLYVSWLYGFNNFQHSSLTTYLAGLQFHITNTYCSNFTIWHPALHRVLAGFYRLQSIEVPVFNRSKLPFTRQLIIFAQRFVLGTSSMAEAHHAALCFGFMFLLRKSEYLTNSLGHPRMVLNLQMTIIAANVLFWFGNLSVPASGPFPPLINSFPDFVSIFIPVSKADQFGKGATRFFPADHSNANCLCRWMYLYAFHAHLQPTDSLFWSSSSPEFRVYDQGLKSVMRVTAHMAGLPPEKLSLHSLRIGGLVALYAAGVPSHLKQLAGRWSSEKSFIPYARATMEQFAQIASALNNPLLVSTEHLRHIYSHPSPNLALPLATSKN